MFHNIWQPEKSMQDILKLIVSFFETQQNLILWNVFIGKYACAFFKIDVTCFDILLYNKNTFTHF